MTFSATNGRVIEAGSTAVSSLEPELLYRGYPVDELVSSGQFLETAYLLICGDLPTDEQLADWQALLFDAFSVSRGLQSWLKRAPESASTLDVLQAAVARQQLIEPADRRPEERATKDAFPRWLGFLTGIIAHRVALRAGREVPDPRADLSFAANLWWLFHEVEPPSWIERAVDGMLVLCAEHGFAPATCAVRLAGSTGAEFSFSLLAGLSVVRGERSAGGLANSLNILASVRTADRATAWVQQAVQKDKIIPGFVHRVYRTGDPRTDILAPACRQAAELTGRMEREELASVIEQAVWEQKRVLPSLVWPAARLADYLGLSQDLFAPLFVLSRMAGWAAHYAEQRSTNGQPIFRGQYAGPSRRHFRPQSERT